MKKLNSLLDYLLTSPLSLKKTQMMCVIENGKTISYVSDRNQAFALQYHVIILISDFAGDVDAVLFILLIWLDQYQPDHAENAIQFESDILDHQRIDLTLKIQLTERIQVTDSPAGTVLTSVDDPQMQTVTLSATLQKILDKRV